MNSGRFLHLIKDISSEIKKIRDSLLNIEENIDAEVKKINHEHILTQREV